MDLINKVVIVSGNKKVGKERLKNTSFLSPFQTSTRVLLNEVREKKVLENMITLKNEDQNKRRAGNRLKNTQTIHWHIL